MLKTFQKSARLSFYLQSWAKWYLFVKFNCRQTNQVPQLVSWSRRSLYTHRLHFNHKKDIKKAVLMHLFWVLDLWQLNQPCLLKGISSNYPIRFETMNTGSLEVHGLYHNWLSYLSNKEEVFSYKVTRRWLTTEPTLWLTRTYNDFVTWCPKTTTARVLRRGESKLWFITRWFLTNYTHHKLQFRFRCQIPTQFPLYYTRILWLRLMQYPCVYNMYWFPMLRDLSQYAHRTQLPWSLLYTSKQAWTFDHQARGLSRLVKGLVSQRMQITEYILFKRWKDLLSQDDVFSRSFQIFIRNSIFFRQFLLKQQNFNNGIMEDCEYEDYEYEYEYECKF